MKERIQELAKRIPHWRVSENPPNGATVVYDSEPYGCGSHIGLKSLEEFAELIVKECIDVCANGWQGEFTAAGIAQCVSDLKQHFGVEE